MIGWQNPAAFAALTVLAGPIVIHLFQRRRARRVAFPTDRFIRPAVTGAVRLRLPADLPLMLVRLAILGAAVCAVAEPVFVTRARMRTWDSRIARAVVVDVSDSMSEAAPAAAEEADLEIRSATTGVRLHSPDLPAGIRRAAAALAVAPPARREIVVVSDFQRGALTGPAIRAVPETVGLRFVRVGARPIHQQVAGPTLFAADGRAQRMEIAVDVDRTAVALVPTPGGNGGLRIAGAADEEAARLMRAVASSGAPAPSVDQPIVVKFGGDVSSAAEYLGTRWMLGTVLRLRRDPELSRAATDGPTLRASGPGSALLLNVDATPDSYVAAATVRGALTARHGDVVDLLAEQEVGAIPDERLTAWSREADGVMTDTWRHASEKDASWFWGIALVLLVVEAIVRASVHR